MEEKTNTSDWLGVDKEDLQFLAEVGGFESVFVEDDADADAATDGIALPEPNTGDILKALSAIVITDSPDALCQFVAENKEDIYRAALFDEDIARALLAGYKMGVSQRSGGCANDLGALYYLGDFVEQDYKKAAELYELAIQWGCEQSIINMGYIYEYGRIGKPDYTKAYEYYSLASALTQKSEALCKLGDMYSRGKSVARDMAKAVQLWERSLQKAHGPQEFAQPAIRLAPLYLEGSDEAQVKADPLLALQLYQRAEIGLRIDIKDGLAYHGKRLKQAMEGQEKARLILDEAVII